MNGRRGLAQPRAAPTAAPGAAVCDPLLLNGLRAPRRGEDEKSTGEGEERQSANPQPPRGIGDYLSLRNQLELPFLPGAPLPRPASQSLRENTTRHPSEREPGFWLGGLDQRA